MMLKVFVVNFFLIILSVMVEFKFTNIDKSKYQAGKSEYDIIQKKTELPDYGYCWKRTVSALNNGCKQVTAELQGKLALAYLNCFLLMQGLSPYQCEEFQTLSECTSNMKDADRNTMATFFTHTQNICYFLEAQVWHDQTEKTISRLANSADDVASQLEESSELQSEMIQQQKESMENQKEIIDKATILSKLISSSTDSIHSMFDEFRNTTSEQRTLINDMFNKISHLQSMVIGEFTGFYSVVYYALMLVVSYLLTSTHRTASARFWLFGIATVNFLSERFAISFVTSLEGREIFGLDNDESIVYAYQWCCRKCSAVMALIVLMISAYSYQDYNVINNHLLLDIRKQISDLKNVMPGTTNDSMEIVSQNSPDSTTENMTDNNHHGDITADTARCDSSDSGCSESTTSMSGDTDHTYVPSSVDSYSTCLSYESNYTKLSDELSDIRGATPLKELAQQIDNWSKTGKYMQHSPIHSMESRSGEHTFSISATPQRSPNHHSSEYHLRPRSGTPVWRKHTCCSDESPRNFAKTVKAMEKLSQKNSLMTRYTAKRKLNVTPSRDG